MKTRRKLVRPKAPTTEQVLMVLGAFARRLIADPEYLARLRNRVIDGLAGDKAETMLINIGLWGIGEQKAKPAETPPAAPGAAPKKRKGRGKIIPIRPKEPR